MIVRRAKVIPFVIYCGFKPWTESWKSVHTSSLCDDSPGTVCYEYDTEINLRNATFLNIQNIYEKCMVET